MPRHGQSVLNVTTRSFQRPALTARPHVDLSHSSTKRQAKSSSLKAIPNTQPAAVATVQKAQQPSTRSQTLNESSTRFAGSVNVAQVNGSALPGKKHSPRLVDAFEPPSLKVAATRSCTTSDVPGKMVTPNEFSRLGESTATTHTPISARRMHELVTSHGWVSIAHLLTSPMLKSFS